ncbi:MAG: N-acetylglucosamine-6-phosphate deacetylase [Bryobacteraceae bacterium]|nr:N-acetylglucosamine-6-phosphate deacetylase [Bryobacteraceae bacterium]
MNSVRCLGRDALTGEVSIIEFGPTIAAVQRRAVEPAETWLAPGFIDLQINGFAGVDYNDPRSLPEDILASIRNLFSTGVTRLFPTVITAAPEDMLLAVRNLAKAREMGPEGKAIAGIHLEGPYISAEDGPRGAHPARWVRPPDLDEFRRLQEAAGGLIRLVTLAPEWPQALAFIEALTAAGVTVAIGHTAADGARIAEAVRAGASLSTHLGNGAHPLLPRHPNYIWEQLAEDRLTAGFIVDGIHLPSCFLKVALRAKGLDRSFLVTDATAPANCQPGRYRLGQQEVELTADGRVVLAGQNRLAGSALRMDRGIENLMELAGLSLSQAVAMATVNPARAVQLPGRQRGLEAGELGDVVEFTLVGSPARLRVRRTWLAGALVYEA